jgi:hypothetical protein
MTQIKTRRFSPYPVNQSETNSDQSGADSGDLRQQRRFVRWLLFVLVVTSLVGVASLFTGVTSFRTGKSATGTVTILTHHTLVSRVVLSAATIFHIALVIGILVRSRRAWSAAFVLPAVWALMVVTMNWSELIASSGWSAVIPVAFVVGMAVWRLKDWRRQWAACEGYFR